MAPMHFEAVVVGSGFGGSVTAYRLAEAGLNVCLLERGKAYPPGSFPRSPHRMRKNFWDPSAGLYGMFDVWSFRGLGAVVSSGLGGGSLIYANVLLRKDEHWFVKEDLRDGGYEYWPVNRADLDPHYDRVERMMKAQPYPIEHAPYNTTSKTNAFKAAAQDLQLQWFRPPLAVTFANEGRPPVPGQPIQEDPSLHGPDYVRSTCRLCGECDIGCNYGSKNSLDFNYLSAAKRHGADIRTRCEVRSFAPRPGGGYTISYVEHQPEHEGKPLDTSDPAVLPLQTITADRLILAAGTLGSTYLLLKNKENFPRLSKKLGTRFCGNGDLLTFAVKCSETSGGKRMPRVIDSSYGPVITSTIRVPDQLDGNGAAGRGFYLQDAGYPDFANWMLQLLDTPSMARRALHVLRRIVRQWLRNEPESNLSAEIADLFGTTELSAGSMPILGMGRDIPDGNMWLNGKRLDIDWTKKRSTPYFDHVMRTSKQIADALGATFRENPTYRLNRLLTVHPLGGCPMGRDEAEGVVDAYGQVFNYPGLYIADGSVMPGPVGPNPSLTIAALADRFADHMLTKDAFVMSTADNVQPEPMPEPLPEPMPVLASSAAAPHLGLQFTETMKGHFSTRVTDDYARAAAQGEADGSPFQFTLTITADDVDQMLADAEHSARLSGSVLAPALSPDPLSVADGTFNLFVVDAEQERTRRMRYRMVMETTDGRAYYFDGFKVIHDDFGFDVWADTTTLYITVYEGRSADGPLVGKGILKIFATDFARQLTTIEITNAESLSERLSAKARFGQFFLGALYETYKGFEMPGQQLAM
ncbi:MAG TPA: GMC family oxidoreductase [Herpetosiphonaceae bacterium]